MLKWPNWSAPLLGMLGGAGGGLAIAGDPQAPFSPWQGALGGALSGLGAGLIVWFLDNVNPGWYPSQDIDTSEFRGGRSSRWAGFSWLMIGLACLAVNHALSIMADRKFFPLVLGGCFFAAIGLAGLASPPLLSAGLTGEKVPIWGHLIGGIAVIGGIVLGFYLWLIVY